MSLIRTLLIIAIIYFAIRFIARFILPMLVKNAVNKAQENMQSKMDEMYRQQNQKEEGEISIKNKPRDKNKKDDNEGEYVDFEEVK